MPLAFATFLVWRLRTGVCGVGACDFWRLWQLPEKTVTKKGGGDPEVAHSAWLVDVPSIFLLNIISAFFEGIFLVWSADGCRRSALRNAKHFSRSGSRVISELKSRVKKCTHARREGVGPCVHLSIANAPAVWSVPYPNKQLRYSPPHRTWSLTKLVEIFRNSKMSGWELQWEEYHYTHQTDMCLRNA